MTAVKKITTQDELQQAYTIRDTVFVQEQGCPADLEHEHDEDSVHFLATWEGIPAGAARWRRTDTGCKLERFAVLPRFRRKGIARALITAVLEDLPADAGLIYLNAQVAAVPVYLQAGFEQQGAEFLEAGIRHFKMVKVRQS